LSAIVISFAAGLMRGFSGIGSALMMAPFFVGFFGPLNTVTIIGIIEMVVTIQMLPGVHRELNWRLIGPMAAMAACFMPLGSWLVTRIDPDLIKRGIGVLLITLTILLLSGWRYRSPKRMPITLGVGAASGILITLTSLGGPPVIVYLLSGKDGAAENRANFTGYFGLCLIALFVVLGSQGMISVTAIKTALMLLPGYVLAVWIGSRMFRKSNEELYRRVAFAIVFCAGLFALLS
jgi:uncharacterized protein